MIFVCVLCIILYCALFGIERAEYFKYNSAALLRVDFLHATKQNISVFGHLLLYYSVQINNSLKEFGKSIYTQFT